MTTPTAHAPHSAPDSGDATGAVAGSVSPCSSVRAKTLRTVRMHPSRHEAARIASGVLATALQATSTRSVAAALDVHHATVAEWAEVDAPAAFTTRDLIAAYSRGEHAFARRFARELTAMFAEADAAPERPYAVGSAIAEVSGTVCGLAMRIEADGHVSTAEEAEFLAALRGAAAVIERHLRAREAARGLMGKR